MVEKKISKHGRDGGGDVRSGSIIVIARNI